MSHPFQLSMRGLKEATIRGLAGLAGDGDNELQAAQESFAEDGWLPLTSPERAVLAENERCSACCACNVVCPLVKSANLTRFTGPMDIPLKLARLAPDLRSSGETLAYFDRCGVCRACEEVCPLQIPILTVVKTLRRALSGDPLASENGGRGRGPDQHELNGE